MKRTLWVLAIAFAMLSVAARAGAIPPDCSETCYSDTDCYTSCWDGFTTSCGDYGTCNFDYCSDCTSNSDCSDQCYPGTWPNRGELSTCNEYECYQCDPNYVYDWSNVGVWSVSTEHEGNPNWWTCALYYTEQWIGRDQNQCRGSQVLYDECRVGQIIEEAYGFSCCVYVEEGCSGEVWPTSCTN